MNESDVVNTAYFLKQAVIPRMIAMPCEDFCESKITALGLGNGAGQEGVAPFVASEGGCCGLERNFRSQLDCPSIS